MNTRVFVLDANVALKWFLPEARSAAAARLQGMKTRLHVPDLFRLEFGSAVLKRIRRREISIPEGLGMIQDIRLVPLERHPDDSLFPLAFQLASLTGASLYDCMYLALAVELKSVVVTADRRFLRTIAETEYADYGLWIEDLPAA